MALAMGPTSSVAVVACLLATVGFGGWRRAMLPAPLAEKVPLHQATDVADTPDLVPSASASQDAQVKQLPQHVTRPRMRLQDGRLWTPKRAAFFRKTGWQCPKPTAELLLQPAQRHPSQPVREQQAAHGKGDVAKDVACVTAIGQKEPQEGNGPCKLSNTSIVAVLAQAVEGATNLSKRHLASAMLAAGGSGIATFQEVAGSLALLLVLPVCCGCWFCLRRRQISTEEIQQASKAAKVGKVADKDTAKSMLQSVPSPSRQRTQSQLFATDKVVETQLQSGEELHSTSEDVARRQMQN